MFPDPYPRRWRSSVLGPLRLSGPQGRDRAARSSRAAAGRPTWSLRRVARSAPRRLIDGLWGENPPRTAGKSLQNVVLRVRKAFEPERSLVVTEMTGYRLAVEHVDRRCAPVRGAGRRRGPTRGAGSVARNGVRRSRRLTGPGCRGAPTRGAARVGARGTRRRRPGVRGDDGDGRRARGSRRPLSHARTGVGPADDRALPAREAGGRAGGLRPGAGHARGRPGDRPRTGAARRAREGACPGPEPGRPAPDPVLPAPLVPAPGALVGRERELAVLRNAWEDALAGRRPVVVVRGPVGAGEHRLAAAFAAEIAGTAGQIRYDGPRGAATGSGGRLGGPSLLVRGRGAAASAGAGRSRPPGGDGSRR